MQDRNRRRLACTSSVANTQHATHEVQRTRSRSEEEPPAGLGAFVQGSTKALGGFQRRTRAFPDKG